MHAVAVAVPGAVLIVIVEEKVRLAAGGIVFDLVDQFAEAGGGKLVDVGDLKIHGQLDFVELAAVHLGEFGDVGLVGFADEHGIAGIFIDHLPHLAQYFVHFRQVVGVLVLDVLVAVGVCSGQKRVVVEIRIFEEARDGVEAEAGDAAIQPEAHHVVHRFADFGIAPVEVGLLGIKMVVIELAGPRVEFPGGVAEPGLPVVGRLAGAFAVAPDVPVALGIGARGAGFDEPRMFVGGVVRNEVHDHADVASFRFLHQAIEIGHGAVLRIDGGVVGDVVAEVHLRRRIHRRDPDGVDAEVFQVVEALGDAVEVADAVAV